MDQLNMDRRDGAGLLPAVCGNRDYLQHCFDEASQIGLPEECSCGSCEHFDLWTAERHDSLRVFVSLLLAAGTHH